MTDIRKERNARNIVAIDLNARDMFVHAFDGEDYVSVDYDSEFESVFRANKFVENDGNSSLGTKSFFKHKKESVLNYLVDKAIGMLCGYDVFIFGGVDEEWKNFLGPCCKMDDETKTASDVASTLYLFTAKLNSLGKRVFFISGAYTATICSRCGNNNIPHSENYDCKVCCLHCSMTVNTVRNLLIMGTFENGLPTECCYSSIYHPDPKSIYQSMLYSGRGETLDKNNFSLFLNFENKET